MQHLELGGRLGPAQPANLGRNVDQVVAAQSFAKRLGGSDGKVLFLDPQTRGAVQRAMHETVWILAISLRKDVCACLRPFRVLYLARMDDQCRAVTLDRP